MQKTILLLFCLFFYGYSYAQSIDQSAVNVSGAHYIQGGQQITWSAGDLVVGRVSNSSGSLSQGFPHNLSIVITEVQAHPTLEIDFSVFPNPSYDYLMVEMKGAEQLTMNLEMVDLQGRVIQQQNNLSQQTKLSLQDLPTGNYFLRVQSTDNSYSKIYKVAHIKK